MLHVRAAGAAGFAGALDLRRAVALLAFGSVAINLDQHGVVDIVAKGSVHGFQIGAVAVCGNLDAIGETARKVASEHGARVGSPIADEP